MPIWNTVRGKLSQTIGFFSLIHEKAKANWKCNVFHSINMTCKPLTQISLYSDTGVLLYSLKYDTVILAWRTELNIISNLTIFPCLPYFITMFNWSCTWCFLGGNTVRTVPQSSERVFHLTAVQRVQIRCDRHAQNQERAQSGEHHELRWNVLLYSAVDPRHGVDQ